MEKVDLSAAFSRFSEQWRPKVVSTLNGQEVKLVKVCGSFPWHHHADADELFLVWRGQLRVEFRDRAVDLAAGELLVVPRGVEHRTLAAQEAEVLIFEPAGVRNTGNVEDVTYTAPSGAWLPET